MKKGFLIIFAALSISILKDVTTPVSAATDTTNHYDEHRAKKFFHKIKKFNSDLNKHLTDKTELAVHEFKANTKSVKQKSNNLKIYWSTFITKMNYLKNDQIEVYVTDEFKSLEYKKRAQIIESVQQLTLSYLDDFKAVTLYQHTAGLPATIFHNGNYLGRSLFLNNKDFKWND